MSEKKFDKESLSHDEALEGAYAEKPIRDIIYRDKDTMSPDVQEDLVKLAGKRSDRTIHAIKKGKDKFYDSTTEAFRTADIDKRIAFYTANLMNAQKLDRGFYDVVFLYKRFAKQIPDASVRDIDDVRDLDGYEDYHLRELYRDWHADDLERLIVGVVERVGGIEEIRRMLKQSKAPYANAYLELLPFLEGLVK